MKADFEGFTEPQVNRRKFLLGGLLASAAGIAALRQPSKRVDYLGKRKLDDLVPKTIGKWNFVAASGLVVPPEDQLSQTLYSQLLTRVYSDGRSPAIMLLLAQSGNQTGFLQVHRPETCYTAGGYTIAALDPHPVQFGAKSVIANNMEAVSSDGQTEHVVYWTRVGDRIPRSWREQRIAVAVENLEGIVPDAILIRASTISTDRAAALAAIDEFLREMVMAVPGPMQRVFTG